MKIISKDQIDELNIMPTSGFNKPKTGTGDTLGTTRFIKPSNSAQKSALKSNIQRPAPVSPPKFNVNRSEDLIHFDSDIKIGRKNSKEDLVEARRAHIERERQRRAQIKTKKQSKKKVQQKQQVQQIKPNPELTSSLLIKSAQVKKETSPFSKEVSPSPKTVSKTVPKTITKPTPVIEEPSYAAKTYDRFISLLRFNIAFKLSIGYAFRLVFLIAFLLVTTYFSFAYFLFYQTQGTLAKNDIYIQSLLQDGMQYKDSSITRYIASEDLYFYYYNTNKQLIYKNTEEMIEYDDTMAYNSYDFKSFPDFPVVYQSGKYTNDTGQTYYFVLAKNMSRARGTIEATFPIGIILCVVLIISSILSSSKMAEKHLRPIKIMTDNVKDMSANNLSTRLNVSGTKDELKDLALTFNQMLNDIQKSYEREKQFVSDASHELRTPIAVIKGYAGMLNRWGKNDPDILEESIQAILGETENMHSLVESLLFIARNDKGALKMDLANFNLSDLLCEIAKETVLIDKQHDISKNIQEALMFFGSMDKIKQALRILVDNSIKYTPDEGEIKIGLRATKTQYVIELVDNGIGISKEDLPHIFDRFYRADKSRTKLKDNQHGGTGLGLSIARIIIEQHGGGIHVASELNVGTTFTIFLPAPLSESSSSEI